MHTRTMGLYMTICRASTRRIMNETEPAIYRAVCTLVQQDAKHGTRVCTSLVMLVPPLWMTWSGELCSVVEHVVV